MTRDDADAEAVVAAQGRVLAPFWVDKYDREAAKAWDRFYRRTSVAPYKDRHYLDVNFPGARHAARRGPGSRLRLWQRGGADPARP